MEGRVSICYSGGASGSDKFWGRLAAVAGHEVCHYSFAGHGGPGGSVKLTQEQLEQADPHLLKANETLGRRFPTYKHFVDNLLRRNWWQIKDTDAVYGIGF